MTHKKLWYALAAVILLSFGVLGFFGLEILTAFMSFGNIQFRIAEMLNHLFAFDRKYGIGVVAGVLLVNSVFMSASGRNGSSCGYGGI